MLQYTGHPLYDVGVATVVAFVGKSEPGSCTDADLDKAASFIEREYVREPLKSFLGVAFTTNAWFNQPSFNKQPQKRQEYARRILRSSGEESPRERCVFTGEAATATAFSDKLPPGRAFRQHIPMLTGEGVINFHPWGDAGLPVSGKAVLCLQAFPLGCAKCGGKLLAVHSDNPDLIYDFAAEFLEDNRQALILAQLSHSTKMPEAKASAKTLLIETLLKIELRRQEEAVDRRPSSVTAYHLTNSGQSNPLDERNPPLEIYHLPLEITGFLFALVSAAYHSEWNAIVERAWRLTLPIKKKRSADGGGDGRPRRNFLYEDLFGLPDNAPVFIRRYFLRIPVRNRREDDPRRFYSLRDEASLVSWKLTELLLWKVMNVDKERIRHIRELGDRLAAYVSGENARRFFITFYSERKYELFRNALVKANLAHVKQGNPPLITLDPYIQIFEEGNEVARSDWRLARDLVLIRMIEQLYNLGWLGKNVDALPDISDDTVTQ
ncbi:MAG: type I-B CRISPR-associated protein Cas8b1/Cst1 [Bacillota bacterium]|jgi:CRISPR-associated protein Cst1|nr:MAG: type I-B CRISPR-associated protein Cas8b1/Cst1 [Ammonifex sp.]